MNNSIRYASLLAGTSLALMAAPALAQDNAGACLEQIDQYQAQLDKAAFADQDRARIEEQLKQARTQAEGGYDATCQDTLASLEGDFAATDAGGMADAGDAAADKAPATGVAADSTQAGMEKDAAGIGAPVAGAATNAADETKPVGETMTDNAAEQPMAEDGITAADGTSSVDSPAIDLDRPANDEMQAMWGEDYEGLAGQEVVDNEGETIGEIDRVVLAKDGDDAFAVIGVGGFLGLGEKMVAVPVTDLQHGQDDKLLLPGVTADSLKGDDDFMPENYREIDG